VRAARRARRRSTEGYANVLPQRTLAAVKAHKVALKGR
jgi:hypothetical protein